MRALRSKTAVRQLKKAYAEDHPPQRQFAFLLQDWTDPYNVGAMFRVADALGASELVMTGDTPEPEAEGRTVRTEPPQSKARGWQQRVVGRAQIAVTSMGAHRRIPWRKVKDHEQAAIEMKEAGWTLVAVEIAEGAVPYSEFAFPEKLCLVLGQEQRGMYDKVLKLCAAAVYIPMAGKGRSLNVTHAAAVVGFWAARAKP